MSNFTTLVLERGPRRFDIVGQPLDYTLHDSGQTMSSGLAKRLHRYGLKRLTEAGFDVASWQCEIYTLNGDRIASDRGYTVEFTNASGGMIGVQGILTSSGHPSTDHGLNIGERRSSPDTTVGSEGR